MDCSDCKNKPSFLCRCSNTYLCDIHVLNHLKLNLKHDLENLKITIDSNDKILLDKELDERIITLTQLEQKIIEKTKYIIKKIEEKSNYAIKEINGTINHYKHLKTIKDIEKSNIDEINSIIYSKLSLNYLNTNSLIKAIETFYSRNFYNFVSHDVETSINIKIKFLEKHCSVFSCLAISNDEKTLISGSSDSSIRIWDLQTKSLISCLTNHKSKVTCLSLSLDNDLFVSGSCDRTIILWSLKEKSFKRLYCGHSETINFVLLTNDSTFILSGSCNMELMLWKTDTNELLKKIIVHDYLSCATIKSNNFCVLGIGNSFEVWDINNLSSKLSISPKIEYITLIDVTSDCETAALVVDNDTLIYSISKKVILGRLTGHSDSVNSISITYDDKILVSGSSDETIILWSLIDYSIIHQFFLHTNKVYFVKTCGDLIYSGGNDDIIVITRISSLSLEYILELHGYNSYSQHFRKNLTAFGFYEDILIRDEEYSDDIIVLKGHENFVKTVYISQSMNLLISSSLGNSKNLILWDLKSLSMICPLEAHFDSVICTQISNNDLYAISGDVSGTIVLWNITDLNKEVTFEGHEDTVACVKFDKDSKYAASGGNDKKFCVWNLRDKQLVAVIDQHQNFIRKIFLSDDSKYFVYQINHAEQFIWNINEVRLERELKNESELNCFLSEYKELEAEFILDF